MHYAAYFTIDALRCKGYSPGRRHCGEDVDRHEVRSGRFLAIVQADDRFRLLRQAHYFAR